MNGQLEFVSGEDMEVLNAAEHFLAAEIEWDPTGRYVATAVTALQKMENGVNLWLFNGQLIYRCDSAFLSILAVYFQLQCTLSMEADTDAPTDHIPALGLIVLWKI